ncbi:Oidioi.mRNA.OKI2018_I69.PAR.g12894.t1.cds [Oikopleura dioica]|uniref:Asparagine synthetase [glutamine-hydrolyzing] n=1 Tax=Oikopleura dioica TaxID=34765 RepID=A0ABN7S916_OIKDI|nr:Oidioi.mRNA.OKI2018_I69.PAR.g12894.t1.cds [Oikopleura dioica]
MCGIGVFVNCEPDDRTIKALKNRGPDFYHQETFNVVGQSVTVVATVLSHQGEGIISQPIVTDDFIFLWNGEVYDHPRYQPQEGGDTNWFFDNVGSQITGENATGIEIMKEIRGEFAFCTINRKTGEISFGRDRLGRRSLLLYSFENKFILASSSSGYHFIELPADGLYSFNLKMMDKLKRHPFAANTKVDGHMLDEFLFSNLNENMLAIEGIKDGKLHSLPVENVQGSLTSDLWNFEQNFDGSCTNDWLPELEIVFKKAVERRVKLRKGSVGVLFSGGLDCSLVVAQVLEIFEGQRELATTVYLYSVAFGDNEEKCEKCPDRITAVAAFQEITEAHPTADLILVKENISKQELQKTRDERIKHLISPRISVLDDSIGSALYFAAHSEVGSDCRLLLSGLGADELFCGYSCHRRVHDREGLDALGLEVQTHIERIAERNCGRDDRVISDSGREYRMPFLDLDLISFSSSIPIPARCDLTKPRGEGEKMLLRQLAYKKGLKTISSFEKRAIQFGSRIVKMEDKKVKGNDICANLQK